MYDEARTLVIQETIGDAQRKLFKPGETKIYLHATLTPRARLILGERAPPQDW